MSLSEPRYSVPPPALRPRADRLLAVLGQGVRERLRVLTIVLLALIYVVVLLLILVPFYLNQIAFGFLSAPPLTIFFTPFGAGVWFFFTVILASSLGAGIIAGDTATRAITMYLSRPITVLDYLLAKAGALAVWLSLAVILPGAVGAAIVLALGYVSLPLALHAAGGFLLVGALYIAALGSLALLLSSLASKSVYAGAAIFGVLIGTQVIAAVLEAVSQSASVLYLSLQDDALAVARALFSVAPNPLNPWAAGAVLLGFAGSAFALTYLRLAREEVIAE